MYVNMWSVYIIPVVILVNSAEIFNETATESNVEEQTETNIELLNSTEDYYKTDNSSVEDSLKVNSHGTPKELFAVTEPVGDVTTTLHHDVTKPISIQDVTRPTIMKNVTQPTTLQTQPQLFSNFTEISKLKLKRRKMMMQHRLEKIEKERERDIAKEKARYFKEAMKAKTILKKTQFATAREGGVEMDLNRPVKKKKCLDCEEKLRKEILENNRRDSLKRQLMKKLQTDLTKSNKMPLVVPDIIRQGFMGDDSEIEDDGYAKTTDIIIFGHDITRKCKHRTSTGCYKFNIRNKIPGKVVSAELFVYKLHDPNDGQQIILLSELERPKFSKLMPRNIVARKETDIAEGWLSFRLDKTVQRWADNPYLNDGISLKCKTCVNQRHKQLYSAKEGYKPVLVIHLKPESSLRRQRRSVECGTRVSRCCRHNFYINFRETNIIRVIEPEGIWANYCTGSCGGMLSGHFNHTSLMQDVRWNSDVANSTIREAITPCCGAVRLKAVSILYADENGDLRHSTVPDLIVHECGCL